MDWTKLTPTEIRNIEILAQRAYDSYIDQGGDWEDATALYEERVTELATKLIAGR